MFQEMYPTCQLGFRHRDGEMPAVVSQKIGTNVASVTEKGETLGARLGLQFRVLYNMPANKTVSVCLIAFVPETCPRL